MSGSVRNASNVPSLPVHLRCEARVNPAGLDECRPLLSWEMQSARRTQRQTAFRILVSTSPALLDKDSGDLWDSGRFSSDETLGIEYAGGALRSHQRCYWKVRLWDQDGEASNWSAIAEWSMGLLESDAWKDSSWIGFDSPRISTDAPGDQVFPAVHLRNDFAAVKPVKRAVLYATAFGWYDAHLNGRRVNETFFDPGWTDYAKRVYYRAFDVTGLLQPGKNVWGAVLADGWFCGYIGYEAKRDHYGATPRFRAQLHIEYADGSEEDVVTGPQWKAAAGPVLAADILKGESYDARLEMPGWDTATFDDRRWSPVDVGAGLSPLIQAHPGPAVLAVQELKAQAITEPKPGVYVLDFGQNFAGVPRLKVRGEPAQRITLRHAERLNPDGTIYTLNLRSATATDRYICRGGGVETWIPRFTHHGFQYLEVTGLKQKPGPNDVVGIVLSSDTPAAGEFDCDDPMLNQLCSNIRWTQRANFIEIPTDCPQRDERLGWTGDAQIYVRTASLNADVQAFFDKWLADLDDAQREDGQFPMVAPLRVAANDGGPAWADAGVICPWTIYEVYGDRRQLARHYPAMCRFIEFCRDRCSPELKPPEKYHCFGDWLSIGAETPHDVIFMAYFAYSTRLAARAAEALGKAGDAAKWNALFDRIKAAFNRDFVGPDGRIKGDTQTGCVLAIAFDLLDPVKAKLAADHLVENINARNGHLSTGFIGTKDLMLALAKSGRNDVALRLIHNDTFPSWGFSIKHGATSIWERWDGWTPEKGFQSPSMNSFSHYSFGAVYQWMVENLGGIRSGGPAYRHVIIAPTLDERLQRVRVGYRSVRGQIESSWERAANEVKLRVVIPANATATVVLPADSLESVTESGGALSKAPGVLDTRMDGNLVRVEIGSGDYRFAWKLI